MHDGERGLSGISVVFSDVKRMVDFLETNLEKR